MMSDTWWWDPTHMYSGSPGQLLPCMWEILEPYCSGPFRSMGVKRIFRSQCINHNTHAGQSLGMQAPFCAAKLPKDRALTPSCWSPGGKLKTLVRSGAFFLNLNQTSIVLPNNLLLILYFYSEHAFRYLTWKYKESKTPIYFLCSSLNITTGLEHCLISQICFHA